MNKLKTIFRSLHWKNILGLTIAGLINAFGITIFLSPVNLYDSGISGTSMLLSQITPEHLSLSVFLIILNIPLFLYGWKKQGNLMRFRKGDANIDAETLNQLCCILELQPKDIIRYKEEPEDTKLYDSVNKQKK